MAPGRKLKLKDQLGRVVTLNDGATDGATVGVNLYGPDGRLLRLSDILNPPTDQPNAVATVWKLIREVPANLVRIAALEGKGIAVRQEDGEWVLRLVDAGEGIEVTHGDGGDGNPVVSLADLPDAGGGELLAFVRDGKGRVSGTRGASTDDLAEGTGNLYFTSARADARIAAQKGQPNGLAPLGSDSKVPAAYLPTPSPAPVQSVNGKTGVVVLAPADIGAATSAQGAKADSALQAVQQGAGITVDNTDPRRPVVSATGGTGIPEAPTDGSVYARGSSAWEPLNGALSRFVLLELPPLLDQQGRALTDQQGRPLYSSAPQIPVSWVVGAQAAVKDVYPLNALPPVSPFPREIYVSGTSGVSGIIPAYSDGVNWLRFSDNTPVN